MKNRTDRNIKRPDHPRRLAMVDADVNLHDAVREQFSKPEVGWQVDAYTSTKEAWRGLDSAPPHVALVDCSPPTGTGLDCIRRFRCRKPNLPVVVFTAQVRPGMVLRGLMAGASGFLIKPLPSTHLLPQLQRVLGGRLGLCAKAEGLLRKELHRLACARAAMSLTQRESDVMHCLCHQMTAKEIAEELSIGVGTVHTHLMTAYGKLGAHGRAPAIRAFLDASLGR